MGSKFSQLFVQIPSFAQRAEIDMSVSLYTHFHTEHHQLPPIHPCLLSMHLQSPPIALPLSEAAASPVMSAEACWAPA